MIVANAMATLLPINGQTTAEVSAKYTTFFTPAGYVFSIWGLIYILLGGFVLYQGLGSQKDNQRISRAAIILTLANIVNTVWIFAWHFELFEISLLLMVSLLFLLIAMYQALHVGEQNLDTTRLEKLFVYSPVSVYVGRISVATVANASVLLSVYEWSGFGISQESWAAIMIGVVTILTFIVLVVKSDWVYATVIVWAFWGLRNAFSEISIISITATVASVLIVILSFIAAQSRQRVTPSVSS